MFDRFIQNDLFSSENLEIFQRKRLFGAISRANGPYREIHLSEI